MENDFHEDVKLMCELIENMIDKETNMRGRSTSDAVNAYHEGTVWGLRYAEAIIKGVRYDDTHSEGNDD